MSFCNEFSHVLTLPPINGIHKTVIAFLQTSNQGTWDIDDSQENNAFVLHFVRGNWRSSLFSSKPVAGACDLDHRGEFISRSKPMRLDVVLRPSPTDITITVRHLVYSKHRVKPSDHEAYVTYWRHEVRKEVLLLRAYVMECHNLEEAPSIEGPGL